MIETERLLLRLPLREDTTPLLAFYKENEDHLNPWDPQKPEDFYTEMYWTKKVEEAQKEFEEQKSLRLNMVLKESQELVGMANFTNFERGPFQNCRLGYKIGAKHEGQGLMSEALKAALEYIFKELNFHRVEANSITTNERSRNLLKRLGFQEHGVAKEYLRIAGKWQDHVLTSLVNPSWKD